MTRKPYHLNLAPYDGAAFFVLPAQPHFNKPTTMVCEASDIRFRGPERLYRDACDVGIAIRSPRTGLVARFYLASEDYHGDELAGWTFRPAPESQADTGPDLEICILND